MKFDSVAFRAFRRGLCGRYPAPVHCGKRRKASKRPPKTQKETASARRVTAITMSRATTTHCVRTDPGPQRRASGAGAHRYILISRSVSSGAIRKELCASVQNGAKMEEMARKSKIGRSPCRSKASLAHRKFVAGSLANGSLPALRDTVWQSPIRRRSCQQCEEVAPSTARHRRRWASGRTQAHMRAARPPPDRSAARALRSERAAHAHFSASGRCGPRSQAEVAM